ncbi:hypothetical protein HC031_03445 [Planosporangium thailandense]|uniref:Uncharacterized protein n=1 Tax=Planosporangium thailandense TaxID=765197 RepID=A0ABX0XU19_9ACTN|nr:hypothetical protein [Planosporangium thailandense]NJC68784.1 hypothetical protein [Planosporangium thailandense]
MTTGPNNYTNGSANGDDHFASQLGGYRPTRGESAVLPAANGDDLGRRNGSTSAIDRVKGQMENTGPIGSSLRTPELVEPELDGSVFTTDPWNHIASEPLADHPLLRGLLLELPAKGNAPSQEWLDRWFEAARSILELLYSQSSARR